jgi:hypothetical protein
MYTIYTFHYLHIHALKLLIHKMHFFKSKWKFDWANDSYNNNIDKWLSVKKNKTILSKKNVDY